MASRIGTTDIIKASLQSAKQRIVKDAGALVRIPPARSPGLRFVPGSLAHGDTLEGLKILDGRFQLGSQSLDVGANGTPWTVAAPSPAYARRLHSFNWLAHLSTLASSKPHLQDRPKLAELASQRAKNLISGWVDIFGKGNPFAWREDILVERIYAWLVNGKALALANDTSQAGQKYQTSLYQQIVRLRKNYKYTQAGISRLKAATCLVLAAACFDGKQDYQLDKALDLLDDELDIQILPDGGHISRNPQDLANALEILIVTEQLLMKNGVKSSREIRRAIDRITPMLGFFRKHNGNLFSFNGGGCSNQKYIKTLIKSAGIKAKNFGYAPHSHYQRLERNNTVLLMDVGDVPPRPFDNNAHLAPLAFEISTANGPLIVNCGYNPDQPDSWRQAMRRTAAHSTLVLDNNDTGELIGPGWKSQLFGAAVKRDAAGVKYKRREQENGIWLEASHNGYLAAYGLQHVRRIYMDISGRDIRGEDILLVPAGHIPPRNDLIGFAIRFHLHPALKVTLARDQKTALLVQPGNNGWHFRSDTGPLRLEKSVYLAEGKRPKRCEQLVVHGRAYADGDGRTRQNRVRWTLKRLGAMQ